MTVIDNLVYHGLSQDLVTLMWIVTFRQLYYWSSSDDGVDFLHVPMYYYKYGDWCISMHALKDFDPCCLG